MKFLKYLLIIIAAIAILFIAIGFIHPAVNYGSEVVVDKPIKEAWGVSQDESKYALWLEGFKSIELISGEKGALGSKYKVVVNPGEGKEDFEMTQTVVSMKEFDHVDLTFDSDMMDFAQKITFSEADGKTMIKTDSEVKGKGVFMRSMFALMEMTVAPFEAQETKNMEALKVLIEENTKDYYPAPVKAETVPAEVISN